MFGIFFGSIALPAVIAVNGTDVPFQIRAGKRDNELIAEWKYGDGQVMGKRSVSD